MTSQSRFGILVGLVVVLALGLVVTELQRDDAPVEVPTPDPVASHHHARPVAQIGRVVEFTPRESIPRVVVRPPAPQPIPQPVAPRVASDERTTEAANAMLAAFRAEPVPEGRPMFVEMDTEELREHFNVAPTPEPTPSVRRYASYTVQSGDTLTAIARRAMNDGSPSAINHLFELNRNVMDDPNHLVVGMTLRIPADEGR
jgi:nucleoid-associated protein YgaU